MQDFNKIFKERYKKLNSFQKQAVDNIEGPVMVIAGPGTGKTTVLVMRIASILMRTDTEPENILALTYTESGVTSMRRSLIGIVGPDAHKVKIKTFHGFCNELINDFPEEFPEIIGARHIPESEQISLIEKILSNNSFSLLTPTGDPFYYVSSILGSIHSLKREGADPETLLKENLKEEEEFYKRDDIYNVKGKNKGSMKGEALRSVRFFEKNKEFTEIFKMYQDHLKNEHCYDYEDMILEVVKKLENNKEFSTIVQEDNHYILADEHQDANNAQNRVIKELVSFHENPNIFIVGDEKQAIFRFQGASLNNFMYFMNLYPEMKVIYLVGNYRSQQGVLDAAQNLIEQGTSFNSNVHKPLKARSERERKKLVLKNTNSVLDESLFVANTIIDLIEKGVSPSEVAVIYRKHKDAIPFARAMNKVGVPYIVRSDKDLFEDPNIIDLFNLMETVCDPTNDEILFKVLHSGVFGIDPIDVLKINHYSRAKRIYIWDVLESLEHIKGSKVLKPVGLNKAYESIKEWNKKIYNVDIVSVLEELVYDSGIINNILMSDQNAVALNRMKDFFKEAERFMENSERPSIFKFVEHLKTIRSYGLGLKSSEGNFDDRVEFITAHSSKGREFDYVFMVDVVDKKWGNVQKKNNFRFPDKFSGSFDIGDDEDERRLFYVSLTRAREKVFLSFSKFRDDGKEQISSIFIEDINKLDLLDVQKDTDEKGVSDSLESDFMFRPASVRGPSIDEKNYIIKTFIDQPLSITAVNAYFKCPWRYFYVNLMRLPGTYTLSQKFGIAIHGGLKKFFDLYRDEGDLGKEFMINSFENSLKDQVMSAVDEKDLLQKGKKALTGYYDKYFGTWDRNVINEKKIMDVCLDLDFLPQPLFLTGNIDKIEGVDDHTVVDYKTGKPKSRNNIEGNTKNSDGDMKKQLVFYKLLVDNSKEIKGAVSEGVIDFIEPNDSGFYKKETFDLKDKEVSDIKNLITQMAEEIFYLSFWDKRCEDDKCEFCSMRERFILLDK